MMRSKKGTKRRTLNSANGLPPLRHAPPRPALHPNRKQPRPKRRRDILCELLLKANHLEHLLRFDIDRSLGGLELLDDGGGNASGERGGLEDGRDAGDGVRGGGESARDGLLSLLCRSAVRGGGDGLRDGRG